MASFNAVYVQAVIPQQAVTVGLTDAVKGKFLLFIDRVFVRHVADQRLANQRHVARRAVLAVSVQTVHGLEMGIFQAQRGNVAVHQAHKRVLASRNVVGHRHAGVVAGLQVNAADQLGDRHLHAWLQEHQGRAFEDRIAGGPGVVANGHQIGLFKFTCFHRLADDVAGHHFSQARRIAARVSVLLRQHFP